MFNGHRIYTSEQLLNVFERKELSVKEFALIPESDTDGELVTDPSATLLQKQNYACSCV